VNDKLGLIKGTILNHCVLKICGLSSKKGKLLLCNKSNFSHTISDILLIITYISIMDVSRSTKLIVKPYLLRIPALTQNVYSFDSNGKVIINGD